MNTSITSNIETINLFTLTRATDDAISKDIKTFRIDKVSNENNEVIALVHYSERFFLKTNSRVIDLDIYPINYEFNQDRFKTVINAYRLSTEGNRKIYLLKPLSDAYYRWYNGSVHRFDNLKSFNINYKLISDKLEIIDGSISENFQMKDKKLDSILSLLYSYYKLAKFGFPNHDIDYDSIISTIQVAKFTEKLKLDHLLDKYEDNESSINFVTGLIKLIYA